MSTRKIDVKRVVSSIEDFAALEHWLSVKNGRIIGVTAVYHGLQVLYRLPIDDEE